MKPETAALIGGAFNADSWPRAILFDLDDTLFDHRRASALALTAMHAAHAPDLAFERFACKHAEVLEIFHARFLAGEFTLDQARVARMQALFSAFDRQINIATAEGAARLYREQHQANRSLVSGATELLDALHDHCRLGIVTNNSTAEQIEKLRALNIASYFDAVVISEDVGVYKPDPKIFAIALDRIDVAAQDAVFIGDNWTSDIVGALNVGMAAVWLDRVGKTLALERIVEHKLPDRLTSAGITPSRVATITSLSPTASAVAAIKTVFTHRHHRTLEPTA